MVIAAIEGNITGKETGRLGDRCLTLKCAIRRGLMERMVFQ